MVIIPKLDPFPHAIIDGHFPNWLLDKVLDEFPPPDAPWRRYGGENEQGKAEGSNPAMWGEYTCDVLSYLVSDPGWLAALCDAFHIEKLVGDTIGGGYHQIETGGRLGVHVDFNRHPSTGSHRRLNCLVYLNHDWQESYGGALELHGEDGSQIDVAPTSYGKDLMISVRRRDITQGSIGFTARGQRVYKENDTTVAYRKAVTTATGLASQVITDLNTV